MSNSNLRPIFVILGKAEDNNRICINANDIIYIKEKDPWECLVFIRMPDQDGSEAIHIKEPIFDVYHKVRQVLNYTYTN